MKKILIALILIALAVAGYFVFRDSEGAVPVPPGNNNATTTGGNDAATTTQNALIRVSVPAQNSVITSPLTVRGEARGNWYFEASFPIKVIDANGKVLGQKYAEAQGEWMTTDFVPFVGTVTFATSSTATGFVVFEKDNPSGLPENAAEIRVPVRFVNTTASRTPIQDAIRALLVKWNLDKVTLEAASLNNGVLTLTFSDPTFQTSGGSARVLQMRSEIEATAKQFAGVNSVRIMPETVFQP